MTQPKQSFTGKIVVISGSTQGLGETTARLFAERGAAGLVICGRHEERGQAIVADLIEAGCQAIFVAAELGQIDDCRKIMAVADQTFGRVDVLVNAAAVTDRGTIWDTSVELWDHMMAVNLRAPFILMQDAVNIMRREKVAGAIVNITSVAAYGGETFLTPYAAAKGGLVILTRNVAYSVMRHHIRVNALNLGWMDTPGEDVIQRKYHSDGQDWLAEAEAIQPFGRLIKPDEAARAIAFLASDEAGLMTGSIVDYDQSVIGTGPVPKPPPED